MPGLDGGHYFLTCLAPVGRVTDGDRRRGLAETLARLPTGQQTSGSPPDAARSPFARNTLNHFARFVVIRQPVFNGRVSGDTLLTLGVDPLRAQPVDRLTTPFLLFAAEIDAPADADGAVRAYAHALWATMREELTDIFGYCHDFAATTADEFHAYLERCRIETTMPFNDYWPDAFDPPPAELAIGPIKAAGIAAGVVALAWLPVALASLLFGLFGVRSAFVDLVGEAMAWGLVAIAGLLVVAAMLVWRVYRTVLRTGAKPFAAAPGGDLPSILKALFVQQQFIRFATEAQGLDDAALFARFGGFIAAIEPDFDTPAQAPGDVESPKAAW